MSTESANHKGPLSGFRVLELAMWHAGPTAACMLADLGAEVIKLESPQGGDPVRGLRVVYGQSAELPNGVAALFEAYNRNKKSITCDLKNLRGQELVYRLIRKSDVFLTSLQPASLREFNLSYPDLKQHNQRLVYALMSGFGSAGPEADRGSYDPIALARSGMMSVLSGGDANPPLLPPTGLADHMSGTMLGYGTLAALMARERTGEGQCVEVSLLGGAIWLGQLNIQASLFTGKEFFAAEPDRPGNPLVNAYQCADGRWLYLSIPGESGWRSLCAALEEPKLADHPDFSSHGARHTNNPVLVKILREKFATKPVDYWCQRLRPFADITFEKVAKASELAHDQQALANGNVVDVDHPELGRVKIVANPTRFSQTVNPPISPAPHLGQHTEEVLMALADCSWEELARLREERVI
jgi:crotonobetainyl-CoA:carnitine CoA-transferase CaiB-like acyl-CoA transferase